MCPRGGQGAISDGTRRAQAMHLYRKEGAQAAGANAPESEFLMLLNHLTSIDCVLDFLIIILGADILQLPVFFLEVFL
jgi:hypothetical protein